MYRISAPSVSPGSASDRPPFAVIAIVVVLAVSLLAYYVHVLQGQVQRGQQFRADLQQSGRTVAAAQAPRGGRQVVAARR